MLALLIAFDSQPWNTADSPAWFFSNQGKWGVH